MEVFWHELWHTVKEVLILLPLLYLTYLLVSYFSHNDNQKYSKILHRTSKKAGPVVGAFLGCIPHCGFSSVMSNLFSRRIITLGTLIAVFIATSDEAIPLMLKEPKFIPQLLILIAIKLVYGIVAGYIIDLVISLFTRKRQVKHEYHDKHCIEHEHKEIAAEVIEEEKQFNEEMKNSPLYNEEKNHKHKHYHDHDHADEKYMHGHCCATNIFLDALKHTAIIIAYVFVITLALNLVEGYLGLEALTKFFGDNVYIQILMSCFIGLIPNCAASVFLVELYLAGVLYFPALVAGLSAGAGVGIIVLFSCNYKKTWQNILIVLLMFALAFLVGMITSFIPIK